MRVFMFAVLLIGLLADHPDQAVTVFHNIQAQVAPDALIQSPSEGEVVLGNVVVRGNAAGDGFQSYEIDFANTADSNNTWYLIQVDTEPVVDGTLAVWNTLTVSDGDYSIRLLVTHTDGSTDEIITHVLVRNYLPVETDTLLSGSSSPPEVEVFPSITEESGATQSTSTPQPVNPAQVSESQVLSSMGKGALFALSVFAILGIYIGLHALMNKRN